MIRSPGPCEGCAHQACAPDPRARPPADLGGGAPRRRRVAALAAAALLAAGQGPARAEAELYADPDWALSTTGYLRAGLGLADDGEDQVCFQAPGARAKYRLGNECELYVEAAGKVARLRPGGAPLLSLSARAAVFAGSVNAFDEQALNLKELFVSWHGAPSKDGEGDGDGASSEGWLSGAEIWAGRRFYKRHDIHIQDFYYWTGTGYGGGFADVDVGVGDASLAYFASATGDVAELAREGDYHRLDARLEGISPGPVGTLSLGADARLARNAPPGAPEHGASLTAQHEIEEAWPGVALTLVAQTGIGAGVTMSNASALTADEDAVAGRLIAHALYDDGGAWTGQAAALVEAQSDGPEWLSAGARVVRRLRPNLFFAVETGADHVRPDGRGAARTLGKVTAALEVKAGRAFFDRPVLRAFATVAAWNDGADAAGVAGRLDGRAGLTFGVQVEHFW